MGYRANFVPLVPVGVERDAEYGNQNARFWAGVRRAPSRTDMAFCNIVCTCACSYSCTWYIQYVILFVCAFNPFYKNRSLV